MTSTLRVTDREDIAGRLLRSSAKASYDPLTTIDWGTPVDPDRYAIAPHRVSLYGTELWDQLTEAQRKELSRQEVASVACVGIWFETILMQMLIRHAYDRDPTSNHVQYSYTEVGDECRHSVMFARFVTKLGAPWYPLDRVGRSLGRWFKATSNGPLTFSAALFVEELLDQMQREMMVDEDLEPLARAVARLHVTEEARHMRYARGPTAGSRWPWWPCTPPSAWSTRTATGASGSIPGSLAGWLPGTRTGGSPRPGSPGRRWRRSPPRA
jgi:hypothetical protein